MILLRVVGFTIDRTGSVDQRTILLQPVRTHAVGMYYVGGTISLPSGLPSYIDDEHVELGDFFELHHLTQEEGEAKR